MVLYYKWSYEHFYYPECCSHELGKRVHFQGLLLHRNAFQKREECLLVHLDVKLL